MALSIEEELGRSLAIAGVNELPQASREWIRAKLASAGLRVGEHGHFEIFTRPPHAITVNSPASSMIADSARMLVETSKRLGRHVRPLAGVGSLVFLPGADATKKYIELRADWLALEEQAGPGGVAQYPDLKTDVDEFTQFRTDWEAGNIDNSDVAGRLNAEVVRVNRVRATLIEHQTGKTTFVQDLPDRTQNIDTMTATPGGDAAKAVDDWAKQHPIIDSLTNPAGPAIPTPWGKLPGGILGGLAIIGGTLLVANQVMGALVRKAVGT